MTDPTTHTERMAGALVICGAASLSFGAWLAWHPAGFIVGGALGLAAGLRALR